MDYFRDKDGTLVQQPKKYIEKMVESYQQMFKEEPPKYKTPLEPNDHPAIDESIICEPQDVDKYLTTIGQLQWLVTLGRFYIFSAVITFSRFRTMPRNGHLQRVKRIIGYVNFTKDGAIRVNTDIPVFSRFPDLVFVCATTIYGKVQELILDDMPQPLGKPVVLSSFVDANLYHDYVTGRALTAILHFINQTPFD